MFFDIKTKLILLISLIFITGCVHQSVSGADARFIHKFCEDKGGVNYIKSYWHGEIKFWCGMDGTLLVSNRFTLKEEKDKYVIEQIQGNNDER